MIDLGPRAGFIIASYGATALVLAGLLAWLLIDGRRQKQLLADLEARGARRHRGGTAKS